MHMRMKTENHFIKYVSFLKSLVQMNEAMMKYGLLIIAILWQHIILYGEVIIFQTDTSMTEQRQKVFIMQNVQQTSLHLQLNQPVTTQQITHLRSHPKSQLKNQPRNQLRNQLRNQAMRSHQLQTRVPITQQQMYPTAAQLLRLMKSERLQKIIKQMMLLSSLTMMLHLHLPKELCQKYHRLQSMTFQQQLLLI